MNRGRVSREGRRVEKERFKGRVEAVSFDLDGTLIDSIGTYITIVNQAFPAVGLPPVPREALLDAIRYGGFDWEKVLPLDIGAQKESTIETARKAILAIYRETFRRETRMFPGAAEILREVARMGYRIGLVTATQRIFLSDKLHPLRMAGAERLLEVMITTDDVERQKPAPDPLILCAERLQIETSRMVYIGDSRVDIQAGKAAGSLTVGVLSGVEDRDTLVAEEADHILETVGDLLPLLEQWRR